jgi:hypothetical protein
MDTTATAQMSVGVRELITIKLVIRIGGNRDERMEVMNGAGRGVNHE